MQYLKHFFAALTVMMSVIVGINLWVDPFGFIGFVDEPGFNHIKPALSNNIRAFKLREIEQNKPQALVLGSSRAQLGLPAEHFGEDFYNTGVPQATIDEVRDILLFANHQAPVHSMVLSVDFFSFNVHLKSLSPFKQSKIENYQAFDFDQKLAALVGWAGLKASVDTLRSNRSASSKSLKAEPDLQAFQTPIKQRFLNSERYYLQNKIYLPYPQKSYALSDERRSSLEAFAQILALAKAQDIRFEIVILPVHARQLALIESLHLWNNVLSWKEQLVKELDNVFPGKPIYDYMQAHAMVNEPVPDTGVDMRYWLDSAHIRPELGKRIARNIWQHQPFEDNFGQLLTVDNLEVSLYLQTQAKDRLFSKDATLLSEMKALSSGFGV